MVLRALLYVYSLQPLPLLYVWSDISALIMQYLIRYRLKVVTDNLKNSFPEKTDAELRRIRRQFYRGFCDIWFETIKLLSISRAELHRRFTHVNPEVIPAMTAHGGGGIAIFGHYANWEWLGAGMGSKMPFETAGVYKPLSSKAFDKLMLHIRSRMGHRMIPMQDTVRESLTLLKRPCYIAFLGDQTPARLGKLYFTLFMGRPAPVHLGIAKISLRLKCPVYYIDIRRRRRGYYEVTFRHIPLEPYLPEDETSAWRLTDAHVQMLEDIIREDPAPWLWSHRRWKRHPEKGDVLSATVTGRGFETAE